MLVVIHGPDTFTAHEVLRQVLSENTTETVENVRWIEGKMATPTDILEALEQGSLFEQSRVVVVEGLLARFSKSDSPKKPAKGKKRGQKAHDIMEEWEPFVARVGELPEAAILILIDAELKGVNSLLKALTPLGKVTQCLPPRGEDLDRWVVQRVATRGGRIGYDVARRLAGLVGGDLWMLTSEVEKLVSYADGAPIRSEMVDDMAAAGPAPSIFMLVDAIVERNEQLARRRLDDMYNKGLSAGYVFTMVARQLRLIAQSREARDMRSTQGPAGELSGLPPFALQRVTQQASRYSEIEARYALEQVLAADRAIKSGVYTDRMALDMLITDLLRTPVA
jgi:DNA polymerase III subunit delta